MIDPVKLQTDALIAELRSNYNRTYGELNPDYPSIAAWAAGMALEIIGNGDALYHTVEHTVMVTMVGLDIIRGKHLRAGGVSPRNWLDFVISLLCHDIGYVRGLCPGDTQGRYATGKGDETVDLGIGVTDASMAPYHVDRGKQFVRARFSSTPVLDEETISSNLERTRFPVPHDSDHRATGDDPGLVRAADLIGQLADPRYINKLPALFYEFEELGQNQVLGYACPDDLARGYPRFFWQVVCPYITDGLRYLRATQRGRQWIANLYANVFMVEHDVIDHGGTVMSVGPGPFLPPD